MAYGISTIRAKLKADATNVTSGGGLPIYTLTGTRIILGMDVQEPADQILRNLQTDGPYMSIYPGSGETEGRNEVSIYEIPAALWIGIDREADNTFVDIELLIEAIKTAWISHGVSFELPEIDRGRNPATVKYDLTVTAVGC